MPWLKFLWACDCEDSEVLLVLEEVRDKGIFVRTAGIGAVVLWHTDDDDDDVAALTDAELDSWVDCADAAADVAGCWPTEGIACGGLSAEGVGGVGSLFTVTMPELVVLRVKNQQSIGVGLPFMTTGPRYSKWNESSWLISWQSNL